MNNNNLTIWMPLYVGDYLRETRHFTTQEHGAYMLLLMAHWVRGDTGLPADDTRLAAITSSTAYQWRKIKPTLLPLFEVSDNAWHHPRLLLEIEKRAHKSAAARKNALKRWSKYKDDAYGNPAPTTPNSPQPSAMHQTTQAWTAGACDALRGRT